MDTMIGRTLTDLEDDFAVTRSLFYCSLDLTASINGGILTLVCSDDVHLNYECIYVLCLSCWSPMDWIDWVFNHANPYPGTFSFTDAEIKRRYKLLTESSLTGGDRNAQMLARAGQWLLFFFTMFRRAFNILWLALAGTFLVLEITGNGPSQRRGWPKQRDDLIDFSRVLGLELIILAFIVTLCSPFDLLGAQFAVKNRSAAAELKEECSEGGILLTSTKELWREACKSVNSTMTEKNSQGSSGDVRGQFVFGAISCLFFLSVWSNAI